MPSICSYYVHQVGHKLRSLPHREYMCLILIHLLLCLLSQHIPHNITRDVRAFKTSFMRHSLWSSQNFSIYIPKESFQWALSSITTFQLRVQCVHNFPPFSFFPIQISIEQKCKGALFVLNLLERYKYFREDYSVGQTVVWLSSIYCKPLQRASCFFQKGRYSRISIRSCWPHPHLMADFSCKLRGVAISQNLL